MHPEGSMIAGLKIEGERPPQITQLHRLAQLSAVNFTKGADLSSDHSNGIYRIYLTQDSQWSDYERRYEDVAGDKVSRHIINRVFDSPHEQSVCLVLGTDDNPLESLMGMLNDDATRLITITVALEDKRSDEQRELDERTGRYVVTGTIGTPQLTDDIQSLLHHLKDEGTLKGEAVVDTLVSGMVGGWDNIPFEGNIEGLKLQLIGRLSSLDPTEQEEAQAIFRMIDELTEGDRSTLFAAYAQDLIARVISLMNPHAYTIFGEIPRAFRAPARLRYGGWATTHAGNEKLVVSTDNKQHAELGGFFRLDHKAA